MLGLSCEAGGERTNRRAPNQPLDEGMPSPKYVSTVHEPVCERASTRSPFPASGPVVHITSTHAAASRLSPPPASPRNVASAAQDVRRRLFLAPAE